MIRETDGRVFLLLHARNDAAGRPSSFNLGALGNMPPSMNRGRLYSAPHATPPDTGGRSPHDPMLDSLRLNRHPHDHDNIWGEEWSSSASDRQGRRPVSSGGQWQIGMPVAGRSTSGTPASAAVDQEEVWQAIRRQQSAGSMASIMVDPGMEPDEDSRSFSHIGAWASDPTRSNAPQLSASDIRQMQSGASMSDVMNPEPGESYEGQMWRSHQANQPPAPAYPAGQRPRTPNMEFRETAQWQQQWHVPPDGSSRGPGQMNGSQMPDGQQQWHYRSQHAQQVQEEQMRMMVASQRRQQQMEMQMAMPQHEAMQMEPFRGGQLQAPPSPLEAAVYGSQASLRARRKAARSPGHLLGSVAGQSVAHPLPPSPPSQALSEAPNLEGSQEALRARRRAARTPPKEQLGVPGQRGAPSSSPPPRQPLHHEGRPTAGAGEAEWGSQAALKARRKAARAPPAEPPPPPQPQRAQHRQPLPQPHFLPPQPPPHLPHQRPPGLSYPPPAMPPHVPPAYPPAYESRYEYMPDGYPVPPPRPPPLRQPQFGDDVPAPGSQAALKARRAAARSAGPVAETVAGRPSRPSQPDHSDPRFNRNAAPRPDAISSIQQW